MKKSSVDTFKAWHCTDRKASGEDGCLGVHYFEKRGQAQACGAYEGQIPFTQVSVVRVPELDIERVPGAFLQNGRVVQPGERP